MYQRIAFGGSYSRVFTINIPDLIKREFIILLTLVVPTVILGIYTVPILDGLNYSVSTLIYTTDFNIIICDSQTSSVELFKDSANTIENIGDLNSNIVSHALIGLSICLAIIFIKLYNSNSLFAELNLKNPPRPHAFTSLALQSAGPTGSSNTNNSSASTGSSNVNPEGIVSQ
jgi:hypothetical protein